MAAIEFASDLGKLAEDILSIDVQAIFREEEETIAVEAALVAEPVLKAHTPVVTGKLRDATGHGDPEIIDGAIVIPLVQPAQNKQGVRYWRFVANPHRIVAWGHDTGRMYPGNPYPAEAMLEAEPPMQRVVTDGAERIVMRIGALR